MCVAVLIVGPAPSLSDLIKMQDANPDGCGVAFSAEGGIKYMRGLTAKDVFEILPHIPRPVLVHFRWATHGGVRDSLIHPFPLGPEAFTAGTEGVTDKGVLIHNGVWHSHSSWHKVIPQGVDPKEVSDTQVAAFLAGFEETVLDSVAWSTAVGRPGRDGGAMEVTLRGDWEFHDGAFYSNTSWRKGRKEWYSDSNFKSSPVKHIPAGTQHVESAKPARFTTTEIDEADRFYDMMASEEFEAAQAEIASLPRTDTINVPGGNPWKNVRKRGKSRPSARAK